MRTELSNLSSSPVSSNLTNGSLAMLAGLRFWSYRKRLAQRIAAQKLAEDSGVFPTLG